MKFVSTFGRTAGLLALLVILLAACAPAQALAVGDTAPSITLPDVSGRQFDLGDVTPGRAALLYFSMADG